MSNITSTNLLAQFPYVLYEDDNIRALATAIADELNKLYEAGKIIDIYTIIDTLDEDILDIMAYDMKVDWYDGNYTLEEKRRTMKNCWRVHRILGTPAAVDLAISAIFAQARIESWYEYSGKPYHYRLIFDAGDTTPDFDKLPGILERIKYYANLRSRLEQIKIELTKKIQLYLGTGLQLSEQQTMPVGSIDPDDYTVLGDEYGNALIDGYGMLLYDA